MEGKLFSRERDRHEKLFFPGPFEWKLKFSGGRRRRAGKDEVARRKSHKGDFDSARTRFFSRNELNLMASLKWVPGELGKVKIKAENSLTVLFLQ